MAVSKRPACTKRVTISSADELPMKMEKHHLAQPEVYANKPQTVKKYLRITTKSMPGTLPGPQMCCWYQQTNASYLQQQLLTAHAEPARGALEPRSTPSLDLPGPGFQFADSLPAEDRQFQFSKYKRSAYETNPPCQFPLNIK